MPGRGRPDKRKRGTERQKAAKQSRIEVEAPEILSLSPDEQTTDGPEKGNVTMPPMVAEFDSIFSNIDFTADTHTENVEWVKCGSDDISSHIPIQLKQKIILKGSNELSDLYSGGTLFINSRGSIETKVNTVRQSIRNIDEWTDAFLIYIAVMLTKSKNIGQELLKYMSVIRDASKNFPLNAWLKYDEQFRLRQGNENTRQSWGSLNNELWLRIMSAANYAAASQSIQPNLQSHNNPPRTCNDFNNQRCYRGACKYLHACAKCLSPEHNRMKCQVASTTSYPYVQQQGTPMHQKGDNYRGRNATRPFRRGNR